MGRWSYNYEYRNSADYKRRALAYAKESAPPAPECTSFTHDRDYVQIRGEEDPMVVARAAKFAGTACAVRRIPTCFEPSPRSACPRCVAPREGGVHRQSWSTTASGVARGATRQSTRSIGI